MGILLRHHWLLCRGVDRTAVRRDRAELRCQSGWRSGDAGIRHSHHRALLCSPAGRRDRVHARPNSHEPERLSHHLRDCRSGLRGMGCRRPDVAAKVVRSGARGLDLAFRLASGRIHLSYRGRRRAGAPSCSCALRDRCHRAPAVVHRDSQRVGRRAVHIRQEERVGGAWSDSSAASQPTAPALTDPSIFPFRLSIPAIAVRLSDQGGQPMCPVCTRGLPPRQRNSLATEKVRVKSGT